MANDFETILESMKDYATFRKPKYMHRDHEDAATYRDRLRGYLTDSAARWLLPLEQTHISYVCLELDKLCDEQDARPGRASNTRRVRPAPVTPKRKHRRNLENLGRVIIDSDAEPDSDLEILDKDPSPSTTLARQRELALEREQRPLHAEIAELRKQVKYLNESIEVMSDTSDEDEKTGNAAGSATQAGANSGEEVVALNPHDTVRAVWGRREVAKKGQNAQEDWEA